MILLNICEAWLFWGFWISSLKNCDDKFCYVKKITGISFMKEIPYEYSYNQSPFPLKCVSVFEI